MPAESHLFLMSHKFHLLHSNEKRWTVQQDDSNYKGKKKRNPKTRRSKPTTTSVFSLALYALLRGYLLYEITTHHQP